MMELKFYVAPDTKQVILQTFFPANLLAKHWKTQSNTTKENKHP